MKLLFASSLLVFLTGCGYLKSGSWTDDPNNWQRAYGGPIPKGWSILHSQYERSPHFTLEQWMFFEVKPPAADFPKIIQPDLTQLEASQAEDQCGAKPSWFTPKPLSQYQIWGDLSGRSRYRLFIDRRAGLAFFYDCQF